MAAAIAAICFPAMWGQSAGSAAREHFLAAQQDQREGQLEAAAEEYKAVLHLQPGIPEVYVNLGLVYYAEAKFGDSAAALETAAQLRPGMRGVDLWLGIDNVRLDRPAQGVALLREAVRQNPDDKVAQSWLGTALWNEGRTDAALMQLRAAAARFPDDPDLLFAVGEAYGKAVREETEKLLAESAGTALSDRIYADTYAAEHDWTRADGHLRRAILRDPSSMEVHLELAHIEFEQAKFTDAQQELKAAIALDPHSAAAVARSGEVLLLMRRQREGVARIAEAIRMDRAAALAALGLPPENRLGVVGNRESGSDLSGLFRQAAEVVRGEPGSSDAKEAAVGALDAQSGDLEGALQAYRSLQPPADIHSPAPTELAQAKEDCYRRRYDLAEAALLQWIAAHPADRDARYELIQVRRHLAMEPIFRLLVIAPNSWHVHQLLAELYMDRGDDDQALAEYRAVAAARPDLPGIHFWIGHLYWKHADADHALVELTRELQIDPEHPEANAELGSVLLAQGHVHQAIPHLELAIRRKPDLWPAYGQLGRAYASEKDYPRAQAMLERAIAHDPDGSIHYQLGLVLHAEGKTAQANQEFAEVRAIKNERMAPPVADPRPEEGNQP